MKLKLLVTSLLTVFAFSKTILVTDIDDTIKAAHIRSTFGKINTAFRTKNVFLGMADLYSELKKENSLNIYYLTNAPEKLMGNSHRATLRNGRFPEGELLLRPSGVDSSEHKVIELEKLIQKESPNKVILIGDNGEHDVHFYQEIMDKHPSIKFHTFIRIAYDLDDEKANPTDSQIGFTTPFEIADALKSEGIFSDRALRELYVTHGPSFLADKKDESNGPLYLPEWQSCNGHSVRLENLHHLTIVNLVEDKINKNCSN
ncbi:phosphatase domain-containing protein [Bacteriovorax sp. Seq25_V]|uniref:phosphatase domain-containing protein n=1 Tax=Bacteriovorax sp. Seq25_V TaxID=1201288 RepID=UPI00038A3A48|nr:phosphatase domain-containing protein [Bacteriovorax sp. Seq25_V]EQC45570.1 PF09949 family protein [Bacteriovorax sp. Seq25_V]